MLKLTNACSSEEPSVRLTTLNCIILLTATFPRSANYLRACGAVLPLEKCWNESRDVSSLSASHSRIALTCERAIASLFVNEDNGQFATTVFDVNTWFGVKRDRFRLVKTDSTLQINVALICYGIFFAGLGTLQSDDCAQYCIQALNAES